MSRWNKRVSLTLNNQDAARHPLDWVITGHIFLCHLIGCYIGIWFVTDVLANDGHVAEGIVFMKILLFIVIYICATMIAMVLTGFPAVADWVKKKERPCKIKLF